MHKLLTILSLLIIFMVPPGLRAQTKTDEKEEEVSDSVLLENQWTIGLMAHTNGWGARFRKGHNITYLKQFMWEIEFSTYKSPKEIRSVNPYFSDSKSYIYGKLNTVLFLRGGVGFQHILNRKPYWGGIQLTVFYYGGFTLGIAKPIYLNIIKARPDNTYYVEEERYNPDLHSVDNIYGRGSLFSGFSKIGLHPGAYAKAGLEFEFGTKNTRINSIEAGGILDFSPIPIAIMAFQPKQTFFFSLYLSVALGKRYNAN